MGRKVVRPIALVALLAAGLAAGVAAAGGPSTVCKSGSVRPQTIAVNGKQIAVLPGRSVRVCATAAAVTVTVPTTVTDTVTTTQTDTVTTTTPAVTDTVTTTLPAQTVTQTVTAPPPPTTTVAVPPSTTVATPPPSGAILANAWVGNPGTCTPGVLAAYDPATACSTAAAAQAAMPKTGGLVRVRCGDYPAKEAITGTGKTGMVTITSETGVCANFDNAAGGAEIVVGANVSYLTLDHLTIGGQVAFSGATGSHNDFDAVTNNQIDVGHQVNGPPVQYSVGTGFWFVGNTVGPTQHSPVAGCTPGCASPEGLRIGKPSSAVASCVTQACNVTIDDNVIQYVSRDVQYWPTGFGPPPGQTCTNADGCHMDGIHIWGIDGGDISRNRLVGVECQGIFIENTNASLQQNVSIVGNEIGPVASGCGNKGIYLSAGGPAHAGAGFAGTWLIAFNSGGGSMIAANGCGSCQPGTVFHFVGNVMPQFFTNATGNGAGCGTGSFGVATVTFDYDVWRTGSACGPTDTVAAPPFVNSAPAPTVGIDMHLLAPPAPSIPCALIPGGCPTVDIAGTPFGQLAIPGAFQ